jgi:hypothetical protein
MIWVWRMTVEWLLAGENRRTRRKTRPSATSSTTNPIWIDLGANPGLRGERPATNDLSHGTAGTSYLAVVFSTLVDWIRSNWVAGRKNTRVTSQMCRLTIFNQAVHWIRFLHLLRHLQQSIPQSTSMWPDVHIRIGENVQKNSIQLTYNQDFSRFMQKCTHRSNMLLFLNILFIPYPTVMGQPETALISWLASAGSEVPFW